MRTFCSSGSGAGPVLAGLAEAGPGLAFRARLVPARAWRIMSGELAATAKGDKISYAIYRVKHHQLMDA